MDFLDITLNLNNGVYKPYNKPNNSPRYVHVQSNHPANIIKQIPGSISKRISMNSKNEEVFNEAAPFYNRNLSACGHTENLHFEPNDNPNEENQRRRRQRNVIWFNPPFDRGVETKVAQKFLSLLDKHFGRNHRYHRIFNRNKVKVSYSCMDNMAQIINKHNRKVVKPETLTERPPVTCNCDPNVVCPLGNLCLLPNVVYRADVDYVYRGNEHKRVYIGVTEPPLKERFGVHKHSFRYRGCKNSTKLSEFVWELRDNGVEDFEIKWEILKRAPGYSRISKTCGLCTEEKLAICDFPNRNILLNSRSEMVSKCRHQNKFILCNQIPIV